MDTVHFCSQGPLFALYEDDVTNDFAFSYWEEGSPPCGIPLSDSSAYTGWDVSYSWSSGSSAYFMVVFSSGWYWCTVSTNNGCSPDRFGLRRVRTEYGPIISDGYGINVAALHPIRCIVWIAAEPVPERAARLRCGMASGGANEALYAATSGGAKSRTRSPGGCAQ